MATAAQDKIEKLEAENERLRYAIQDAFHLLHPQTKVMNPSLLAVREAARILQQKIPYLN